MAPDPRLRAIPLSEAQFSYFIPECQKRGTNGVVEISAAPDLRAEGLARVTTYRSSSPLEPSSGGEGQLDLVIQHLIGATSPEVDMDVLFQDLQTCRPMRRLGRMS